MSPQTLAEASGKQGVRAVLEHESLPEAVRNALRRQILNNELPAGERLVEATIAADLGVSRATVREAMRGLSAEGLIEISPRRQTVVTRMSAEDADDVCFARYVLEHAHQLAFPFRRYQIQKVWRGERPQEGRYREFTQADIDIVARDTLPFHHDVEIARVMAEALSALDFLPALRLQVNNGRLIEGFYRGLGASDVPAVMRAIDKHDKLPASAVAEQLVDEPPDVQAEIIRINTDARPLALQVALIVPILAGLLGLINGFRMMRRPDPVASDAPDVALA